MTARARSKKSVQRVPVPPPSEQRLTWSRRRVVAVLFLGLTVLYFCNFRLRGSGDSLPTRALPFSILREGNLDVNEFTWASTPEREWPYYIHGKGLRINRKFYSVSPIATSVVITPLYILPSIWLAWNDIPYVDSRARVVMVLMEKLSAALLTALSAALLFLLLCRLTTERWALALTLVYALGTSTWSVSSQALWAHGLSELCLVALCSILARGLLSFGSLAGAGAICALMIANRPQMAMFAAATFAYVISRDRRLLIPFTVVGTLFGGVLIAYNVFAFGTVFGGYGGFQHFSTPFLAGFSGLTVSPNRGLFVFTPILVFSVWGIVEVWRRDGPEWVRFFTVALGVHVLMYSKFDDWYAGYTYGPRYFTDVLPLLIVLLVYGLIPLCRMAAVRVLAAALVLYGLGVQAIGVYAADDGWNRDPISIDVRPERVWDWNDTQIGRSFANGFNGFELLPVMLDVFTDAVPAQLVELRPQDLASRVEVVGVPSRMKQGEERTMRARITNLGAAAWPMFSGKGLLDIRHLVFVVQTWRVGGRQLNGIGEVVLLPENVEPGETIDVEMPLVAPRMPGTYDVEVRVTQAIDGRRGIPSPDSLVSRIRVE